MTTPNTYTMNVYITRYVDELSDGERLEILKMIFNSVNDEDIHDKLDGTQIKFSDIPTRTIISIYNYIKNKLDLKKNALKNFPDAAQ